MIWAAKSRGRAPKLRINSSLLTLERHVRRHKVDLLPEPVAPPLDLARHTGGTTDQLLYGQHQQEARVAQYAVAKARHRARDCAEQRRRCQGQPCPDVAQGEGASGQGGLGRGRTGVGRGAGRRARAPPLPSRRPWLICVPGAVTAHQLPPSPRLHVVR